MAIQRDFDMIGRYGCYLLCLLRVANKEDQVHQFYKLYNKLGYIDEECTILRPDLIIQDLLHKKVKVSKHPGAARSEWLSDKKKYIVVNRWYNPDTGKAHFALPNWDPYGDSVTIKNGMIESVRLYEFV